MWISDSEAGGKDEKSTGIAVGDSECGHDVTELLVRERCNFDSLSVKKDAKRLQVRCPEKRKAMVRRICSVTICLLFAGGIWIGRG